MAVYRRKGKSMNLSTLSCFLSISVSFCFLLFPYLVVASELNPSLRVTRNGEIACRECESSNFDCILLCKQQKQLEKLEGVVKNLNDLVSRLESRLLESPGNVKISPLSSAHSEIRDHFTEMIEVSNGKSDVLGSQVDAGVVRKYSTFWLEKFHFVSAVKLSSAPTCVNVFPYRDFEGSSKYFAVGDNSGRLYVFHRSGDVFLEFSTLLETEESSLITTIVSYLSVYKNESVIITGHDNGVIAMHRVWEIPSGDESSSLHVERVNKFELPDGDRSGISVLTVHNVGRNRYVLAANDNGKIIVFREDGTVYGIAAPSTRPVVFLRQRLMFLTETGAGSLDLRTMRLKESECEGLNGSFVKNYVFDVMDRSKAYGTTSEGELIQIMLLGDAINFKCRVRSKRKHDLNEPLALQAIKGYLLITSKDKVSVYNTSSQQYVRAGGFRHLFSTEADEILSSFLHQKTIGPKGGKQRKSPALIASDYDKYVVITLGDGYVAMFRSNLPVSKNDFNSILWTSPVLFFILFLFGAWHFFANKKEALTSWGPDDPFSSPTTASASTNGAVHLGSNARERLANDNERNNAEIMDLRGRSGLRRYGSPPRYGPGGGAGNSYGSGSDPDSRPENRLRTGSELKFRGGSGSEKVREGLFANSQVVGDETS